MLQFREEAVLLLAPPTPNGAHRPVQSLVLTSLVSRSLADHTYSLGSLGTLRSTVGFITVQLGYTGGRPGPGAPDLS